MDKAELSSCFGQVVCGPPGSGKSTYTCEAVRLLKATRKPVLVNLDPAIPKEQQPKAWKDVDVIDIRNLITCDDARRAAGGIGPNASFLYCLDFLNSELGREWLVREMTSKPANAYFIFDLPGQVELVTHHRSVRGIIKFLTRVHGLRLMSVNLVDSAFARDALKFMSVGMLCLSTMMCLELPHINVLTKADLLQADEDLDFPVECYTSNPNFSMLAKQSFANQRTSNNNERYKELCESVCNLLDNSSQVVFHMMSVRENEDSVQELLNACDVACGWRC